MSMVGFCRVRSGTLLILFLTDVMFFNARWFISSASGQPLIESELSMATDSLGPHPFLINPATYRPSTLEAAFCFLRRQYGNTLKQTINGNIREQENDSNQSYLALALTADVGSGLGVGFSHQIINQEEKNKMADRGLTEFIESYEARYSSARAVVEITERVSLGFMMRFLDAEQKLVGNFFVGPDEITSFKPSLFGTGGGFHINMDQFQAGGAYLPPMKGNAEIYSEEKIITSPGMMELSAAFSNQKYGVGIALRRWLYKQDDRPAGTTLDDGNQTPVNLLGLNADHNFLFPRDQQQIGVDYQISNTSTVKFSLAQNSSEFNPSPDEQLPGENESNKVIKYLVASLILGINHKNMTFLIGLTKSLNKKISFEERNRSTDYDGRKQDVLAGIQARL